LRTGPLRNDWLKVVTPESWAVWVAEDECSLGLCAKRRCGGSQSDAGMVKNWGEACGAVW